MSSKMGKRYQSDYTDEELRVEARKLESAVTIPVNIQVEADHRVFDLGEVESILRHTKKIVLQDCGCRTGKGNCDAPRHVCLNLEPSEDYVTKFAKHNPHEVTLEEALTALRKSHEAGLVHMAYTMKGDDPPNSNLQLLPLLLFHPRRTPPPWHSHTSPHIQVHSRTKPRKMCRLRSMR